MRPSRAELKGVKAWYDAHGMAYEPADWDVRSEIGESASYQPSSREAVRHSTVMRMDEQRLAFLEDIGAIVYLWEQREDHDTLEAVEEFFAPYLAWMPHAKRRVIDEFMYNHRSQSDIAADMGITQQAVSKQLLTAFRWLKKQVAFEVRPDCEGTDDELAWQVFNAYWVRRFGIAWPLVG